MKLALLFFPFLLAAAQSLSLSVSPASVYAGSSTPVTASITFTDASPTANIAGFGWTLTLPTGLTAGAGTVGAQGTAAQKVLTSNGALSILIGSDGTGSSFPLNQNAFTSGIVATFPITVSTSSTPGQVNLTLTNVAAASAPGAAVTITATGATLTILDQYDLNGDGTVNSADVLIMLTDFLSSSCTGQAGKVGDGKCGISDVELEIRAALGLIQ
jgi:hypothetical protein